MLKANPHTVGPPDTAYFRVEPGGEPRTYAARTTLMLRDFVTGYEDATKRLQYSARGLQHKIGIGLVDAIWQAGGRASVELRLDKWDNPASWTTEMELRARVQPADRMMQTVMVPHLEYFPADWVCVYCGSLADGLKNPRTCPSCSAPKSLGWRSEK